MLKTRAKTGVFLTLFVLLLLRFSYLPFVLPIFSAVLNVAGAFELYRAAGCEKRRLPLLLSIVLGIAIPFGLSPLPQYSKIVFVPFTLAFLAFFPLAAHVDKLSFHRAGGAFFVSLLVSLFFSAIPALRMSEYGVYYVTLVVLTSVVTEVAAYFIGRAFGKRKLAPQVSPGKTVAGFVGGTVAGCMVILIAGAVTSHLTDIPIHYAILFRYLLLACVIGQIGDLAMSLVKRAAGIKDFGNLLPGHGGVLDRFDSQLFIAPFTLIYYGIAQQIF